MLSLDVERDGLQCTCWSTCFKHYKEALGYNDVKIAETLLNDIKTDPEKVIDIFKVYQPDLAKRLVELGGLK